MPTAKHPRPPEPVDLVLPELVDTPVTGLGPEDRRALERYADADLSGADLARASFSESAFDRVILHEADLRGVHLVECRLQQLDAAALGVRRSSWRSVTMSGSRLGALEAYESTWRSVEVSESKVGYLNARGATWQDVTFRGCVLDELDLAGARLTRVAFPECRIGTLRLTGTTLTDVDLRATRLEVVVDLAGLAGAWVSEQQLIELAPLLAAQLKIRVG